MESKIMEVLTKIKSVKLCLMAHPDNEKDSEFADRISDLQDIEKSFLIYDEMFEMLKDILEQENVSQSAHDEIVELLKKATE